MTLTIASRELQSLVRSPLAWIIAAVLQVFFAWYFLATLEDYMAIQARLVLQDHAPGVTAFLTFRYLAPASALLLLICPLLSMRAFADEYRHNTFALLQSSPIPVYQIVLGKFTGTLAFVIALLVLAILMPLSLRFFVPVDLATLSLSLLGMLSVAAMCVAVGVFFSSLTRHSMVAALSSTTLLLLLWIISKGAFSHPVAEASAMSVSTSNHLGSFFQGILDTRDILYFLVMTSLFLCFSVIRIDGFRYSEAPGL